MPVGSIPKTAKRVVAGLAASLEARVAATYGDPDLVTVRPVPTWTRLDDTGTGVVLAGGLDGRIALMMSMSGRWGKDDFQPPATLVAGVKPSGSIVYRHAYEKARRVQARFVEGLWYVFGAIDVDPTTIGRLTPTFNQDVYHAQLLALAREIVTECPPGKDPEASARKFAEVLRVVAETSFNRAWKEVGFGWWGS